MEFRSTKRFGQVVIGVRKLYEVGNVAKKLGDGVVAYPAPEHEKGGNSMRFELKNVTFTYPVSQSSQNRYSIIHISLSIKPNHHVVTIGTNASGKSTLIRILSRLYVLPLEKYASIDAHLCCTEWETCITPLSPP
ncbi:hypothetical protein BJ165DRAFT_645604 [Panaeolus papilionaceus]|nr:hypothetical protein BJ165DRAFT_645604 [Panaeolus papilionaceus]